jgi:hypothetical protein
MKKIIITLLVIVQCQLLSAQQSVGIGTTSPNGSALLDMTSINKGLLIPRMTGAQRIAIPAPAIGLMVIQTNTEAAPPSSPGLYLLEQVGAFPVWRRIARTDEIPVVSTTWTANGINQYSNVAGSVGIGTTEPDPSAILDVSSTTKGFLIPRMTTAQRNAIVSPSQGLTVYDLNNQKSWIFTGVVWVEANSNWITNGASIYNKNGGFVGIGAGPLTPEERLHVSNGNILISGGSNPMLKFRAGVTDIGFVQASSGDMRIGISTTNTTGQVAFMAQGENRVYIHGNTTNTSTMEFHQNNVHVGSLTANSLGDISITTTEADGLVRLNTQLYVNATQNRVGIGTSLPSETLQVAGNTLISSGGILSIAKTSGLKTIEIKPTESGADGASMLLYNNAGVATIEIDADFGDGDGRVITSELQIRGGSDLAENFDITDEEEKYLKPGMLVSIDTEKEGQLCVTNQATDKKVVGIISGANGIKPGMLMGQQGTIAYGKFPIALAGRVYVLCNKEGGEIKAGDFLTSAAQRGYAKKAENLKQAQGAIIGKAMGKADSKTGYVLVLINLQ